MIKSASWKLACGLGKRHSEWYMYIIVPSFRRMSPASVPPSASASSTALDSLIFPSRPSRKANYSGNSSPRLSLP